MTRRRPSRFRIAFGIAALLALAACGWDPSRPFDREAPQVNDALKEYDAGEAGAAADLLEDYLATGGCKEGNIGTPLRVRERSNGSFDLGLSMFKIAEKFGHRFGDEENDAGFLDPNLKGLRSGQIECALHVVRAIGEDNGQSSALRARARYLEGNLLFLNADYKEAVTAYDTALELVPAMGDAGPIGASDSGHTQYIPDVVGTDAAWNRAVALRRIEEKNKDAGNDASPDKDGGGDGGKDDKKNDDKKDGGDNKKDDKKDAGKPDDDKKDAGKDSGANDPPPKNDPKNEPDAGAPPPPPPSRQSQDDRILDQLESAPTVQQEVAKRQNRARKALRMEDK